MSEGNKDNAFYQDVEDLDYLHRYFNIFTIVIIIMLSSATTVMYVNQEVMMDIELILFIPKLTLACSISYTMLLCCFLVENSSTYVFLAMFNCITYAVLCTFAGSTMVGVFSKEVMFEFSSEIWYKKEMTTNINGASLVLIMSLIQVVFACYLAPTFTFYMKNIIMRKTASEMLFLATDGIPDVRVSRDSAGKFHDEFAESVKRNTLTKSIRYSQVFHTLRKSKRDEKEKKFTTFIV